MWYAVALVMDGRYIDFDFIWAPHSTGAINAARRHLYDEYRRKVGTEILGVFTNTEFDEHPAKQAHIDLMDNTDAYQNLGNEGHNEIDQFVKQYFKSRN